MLGKDALTAHTILITGGGTGLGRSMALHFAQLGARVGICGRRDEPLKETVAAIHEAGGTAAFATADVREADQVKAAIDALESSLGPITHLVNNAAGNFLCPSEDLSPNAFDAVVRIVLYGGFNCTMELGRRWIARKYEGAVVSILTTYASSGAPFVLPSACAKAGMHALTKSLALEWAEYGIRLNGIAPGPFPTEGAGSRLSFTGSLESAAASVPLKRVGRHEELADLAAFLLSPLSGYITGEVIAIDGGQNLKGGKGFSNYLDLPREEVKARMAAMRPKK